MGRSTIAFVLLLAACAAPSPTSTPAPTAAGPADAVTAVATQGPFRLTFTLPKAVWRTDEAIDGEARLGLAAGPDVGVGGSGAGLMGFGFAEVGGDRLMGPASTADCRPYTLSAAQPAVTGITKSGGWSEDDPNAAFYRTFLADPLVHLPPGDWDVTATADFVEGQGCDGAPHTMTATIRVQVTP
jgi:hypothetical protein